MPDRFDVVVAGAGHNSLIAAAYLSKAGYRCLVLEGRPVVGGNCVTEELTLPGFQHDSCGTAHVVIQDRPMLRNDELGLGEYGLEYIHPEIVVHVPFPDGTYLTQWHDIERTCDGIRQVLEEGRRRLPAHDRRLRRRSSRSSTPSPTRRSAGASRSTSGSPSIPTARNGCGGSRCRAGRSSATISRTTIAARSCCGWRSRPWCRRNGRCRGGSPIRWSMAASAGAGACRRADRARSRARWRG